MTKTESNLAENLACGEDFCFVCRTRADHKGRHTKTDLLVWTKKPSIMQSIYVAKVLELHG